MGALSSSAEGLRKFLGSKEHLDWVKKALNAAKIITIQEYKHRKLMSMEVHINIVKAKSQEVTYE